MESQDIQYSNPRESEQEDGAKYPLYDPRSTSPHSTIVFAIELLLGIFVFAVIYSHLFEVSLSDLINDTYNHINIVMLVVLSLVAVIMIYAIIKEGFHKCTVPIPLSYRMHTIVMMVEVALMVYFALKNSPLWSLFFVVLSIHITLFYKTYKNLIIKIDAQEVGEKKAEEYYFSTFQEGLKVSNLYFLAIPLINITEIFLIQATLGPASHGGICLPLLILAILIQDLIILIVFSRKKSRT